MGRDYRKDHQRGRADAASGRNRPPYATIFDSSKTTKEKGVAREHYREGHADKRREMGK